MKAESLLINSTSLLEDKLLECIQRGFHPTLGIVFCSSSFDLERLSMIFNSFNIDIIGCTTAGEISEDTLCHKSISCLLLDVPRNYYEIGFERNLGDVVTSGKMIRDFAQSVFDNPAFIICTSGIANNGDLVLEGLKKGYDNEVPIFGGLAGDDLNNNKTFVFTRFVQSDDGIAAIIFDNDKIDIKGLAKSGWEAIGQYNTITKSRSNVIESINDEPALDFMMRYFGNDHVSKAIDFKRLISPQYPFQLEKESNCEVLRVPIAASMKDKTVTLTGTIKEGNRFRFSISPGVQVVNKTVEEFQQFHEVEPDADALILFSCVGRYSAFGPFLEDEVKGIYDAWKKPMAGFLTYGEFGNLENGVCQFHNETCSLVLIREKK